VLSILLIAVALGRVGTSGIHRGNPRCVFSKVGKTLALAECEREDQKSANNDHGAN